MDVAARVASAALEVERIRAEAVEGGEVVELGGLVVALTNLPAPELNGTRVAWEPGDPVAALVAARDVFRSRGHPFFGIEIEVGRHPGVERAIRAEGLVRIEAWPAMAAAIDDLPDVPTPPGLEIRAVTSDRDLDPIRSVEVATFGAEPYVAERFMGPGMLRDDRIRMFTAWVDDRPVGEASAYLVDGTVGLFGVGVVEPARRRGIGAALTARAARAFDDRADLAWLQPSNMARRLYERLGFRTVSSWEVWIAR
jgi:GNAT superfamily N-acetyltransferase